MLPPGRAARRERCTDHHGCGNRRRGALSAWCSTAVLGGDASVFGTASSRCLPVRSSRSSLSSRVAGRVGAVAPGSGLSGCARGARALGVDRADAVPTVRVACSGSRDRFGIVFLLAKTNSAISRPPGGSLRVGVTRDRSRKTIVVGIAAACRLQTCETVRLLDAGGRDRTGHPHACGRGFVTPLTLQRSRPSVAAHLDLTEASEIGTFGGVRRDVG